MPIIVTCPKCKFELRAPDKSAGRSLKCPSCRSVVPVTAGDKRDYVYTGPDVALAEDDPDAAETREERQTLALERMAKALEDVAWVARFYKFVTQLGLLLLSLWFLCVVLVALFGGLGK
jgi:hypothetical protein